VASGVSQTESRRAASHCARGAAVVHLVASRPEEGFRVAAARSEVGEPAVGHRPAQACGRRAQCGGSGR